MKEFIVKLKENFLHPFEAMEYPSPVVRILRQKKAMKKALQESYQMAKVIGVYSPLFGSGMYLVCVSEFITKDNTEFVVFKPLDMNGILLPHTEIPFHEIRSVCPFDSFYINPLTITGK